MTGCSTHANRLPTPHTAGSLVPDSLLATTHYPLPTLTLPAGPERAVVIRHDMRYGRRVAALPQLAGDIPPLLVGSLLQVKVRRSVPSRCYCCPEQHTVVGYRSG